jgi:hypothetical protein
MIIAFTLTLEKKHRNTISNVKERNRYTYSIRRAVNLKGPVEKDFVANSITTTQGHPGYVNAFLRACLKSISCHPHGALLRDRRVSLVVIEILRSAGPRMPPSDRMTCT